LRQADVSGAADDNDLMLLSPTNVATYSGNDGSNEAVQVVNPAAGNYKVCVAAYGGAASMTHSLSSWVVTPADVFGNLNVLLPTQAYAGGTATVGIGWNNLVNGGRYVGAFSLTDTSGSAQSTTVLRINPAGTVLSDTTGHVVSTKMLND
jgi:hypothetical protein